MTNRPLLLHAQDLRDNDRRDLLEAGYDIADARHVAPAEARRARVVLAGLETWDAPALADFPELGLVALSATGTDNIDLDAAAARGIAVTNVPSMATEEVATHALALALALIRNVHVYDRALRGRRWHDIDHGYTVAPRVSALTLGIVGFGRIGRELARIAAPVFGRIVAYDPALDAASFAAAATPGVARATDVDALIAQCDVISPHLPLLPGTAGMLGGERLRRGDGRVRWLVNVSRGGLITNADVMSLLDDGTLAGAALDVFDSEPIAPDDPLLAHPRVIATPHRAHESQESRESYARIPVENAIAFARAGFEPSTGDLLTRCG